MQKPTPELGVCQWFHFEDYRSVERSVSLFEELGVTCVRTGISWADWHRPGGKRWYRWQMEQLEKFDVLLSIWHTPPSIAEGEVCAGPPRRLQDYADFVWQAIDLYGAQFSHLELWNEPNNRYKWNFPKFDPKWEKFGEMIRLAATTAKMMDKPTVLGGMIPVDHHWLKLMNGYGALDAVDIVAIHGFPEMWWKDFPNWEWYENWEGWQQKVDYISQYTGGRPVWITETGLATWDLYRNVEDRLALQTQMLEEAAVAPVERVYWYSLIDLDPQRDAIEGFHKDENEYHLGLVRFDGSRKPAWKTMHRLLRRSAT